MKPVENVCVEEGQEAKTETASFMDIQPRVSTKVGITYIRHKRLGNTDWGIKHIKFQRRLKKKVLRPVPLQAQVRKSLKIGQTSRVLINFNKEKVKSNKYENNRD